MKLDFLKEAKEKAIQEILNSDMTKLEKLKTIEENSLWGYSAFINNEFPEWEREAMDLENALAEENFINKVPDKYGDIETEEGANARRMYHVTMTDSIFDPSEMDNERCENISYVNAIQLAFERYEEDETGESPYDAEYGKTEGSIPVITTRSLNIALYKTKEEIIDAVYNFCIANKIIGFKNDW